MTTNSVSESSIILEVKGKFKIDCILKRHLVPELVGKISRSLPLIGNAHLIGKTGFYFETSIDAGQRRSRKEFKKGDIAFLSVGHAICFFYTDCKIEKDLSLIGRMVDKSELLESIESGDEVVLS